MSISSSWRFSWFRIVLAIPCPTWSCTQPVPFPHAGNIRQRSRRYGYPSLLSQHSVTSHTARDSFISLDIDRVTIRKKRCQNGSYLFHLKNQLQIQVWLDRLEGSGSFSVALWLDKPWNPREDERWNRRQSWGKVIRIQTVWTLKLLLLFSTTLVGWTF